MKKNGQNQVRSGMFDQGFETKPVVKRLLLTVSLPGYLFPLHTYRCVQSVALWVKENDQFDDKTRDADCRGHQLPCMEVA